MIDDTAQLIARCSSGEQTAWNTLVDRYAGLVYAVIRRQGLREDQCDDTAQQVFATLLRSIGTIRDPAALPGWLAMTARRAAWKAAAAARRNQPNLRSGVSWSRPGPDAAAGIVATDTTSGDVGRESDSVGLRDSEAPVSRPEQATPDDELVRLENAQMVREALDELGGRCRELLMMLFIATEKADYQHIAERLGMPIGSIGPTRARCLIKLAEILRAREPAESDGG